MVSIVVSARKQGDDTTSVVATLRARIADQSLPPGSRLRELQLAEEMGVARSTIREAFALLESRGLIERIPNRGAVVARLDLAQVLHIYGVREVLEGLAARLATENRAPEDWQELVDRFDEEMGGHVERGDYEAFLAGYADFQRQVLEAAANPVLADMLDSIYEKTQVIIRRLIILPGRAELGLTEHRAVLAAMRDGDAEAAERLRRQNMRSAKSFLVRFQQFVL